MLWLLAVPLLTLAIGYGAALLAKHLLDRKPPK
jgi:hypothetical protein